MKIVKQPELHSYSSRYFQWVGDSCELWSPTNGGVSGHGGGPRSELRQRHDFGFSGTHEMKVVTTVLQVPRDSKRVVVAQIKGNTIEDGAAVEGAGDLASNATIARTAATAGNPLITALVQYQDGALQVKFISKQGNEVIQHLGQYGLGATISLSLRVDGHNVHITSDKGSASYSYDWKPSSYRQNFKAGVYDHGTTSSSSDGGKVHLRQLSTSHSSLPVTTYKDVSNAKDIRLKRVTFYGFPDNCPPSAQPHSLGTGTYNNPITFAAAPAAIKRGTIMYVKKFAKYFIMDDSCDECEGNWHKDHTYHTDMWLGPDHMDKSYTRLVGCENAMTTGDLEATLNPPSTLHVDTTPFYDANSDTCMKDASPCHETCNRHVECNECDGQSGSCEEVAKRFSLTVDCFKSLNPHIDCGKGVKDKDRFCQGSGCPLKAFYEL